MPGFGGPVGNMPSVMSHNFSQVPSAQIPRSSFDRSHGHKFTCGAGILVPFFVDEVLPGDTFNLNATLFARLLTPVVPVMDNIYCDTFFFFVPYRLVWDHWAEFNGEQVNPGDSTDYLMPQYTQTASNGLIGTSTIPDYMGIPSNIAFVTAGAMPAISCLPLRAYYLIWNEWFRDQNQQDSIVIPLGDGPDDATSYTHAPASSACCRRNKKHDYFTSSLPWPQKGPSITIPLGTEAPLTSSFKDAHGRGEAFITGSTSQNQGSINVTTVTENLTGTAGFGSEAIVWPLPTDANYNFADLSIASAATINELRQSFQIQKMYERDARGGTRLTEIIRSHFGVISPDARMQRPEYLGGGTSPVSISPIPQTSSTDATTPQGNLAAIGVMSSGRNGFVKSFTEHGVVIGLCNFRTDLTYQQGIERFWSRQTRFDHYWPALSHIGEQSVLQQEIYATGVAANDTSVWGYQERYAEYRYKPSRLSGLMRGYAAVTGTLGVWNLSVPFTAAPGLNSTFIQDNTSGSPAAINKIIAVPDASEQFLVDSYFRFITARPMPTYSVPGLIDHF